VKLIKFRFATRQPARQAMAIPSPEADIRVRGVLIHFGGAAVASTTAFAWQVSTFSLLRFQTQAPTTRRVPGRPILSEIIRSTALLRSRTEY
jgi:hypothetical protein